MTHRLSLSRRELTDTVACRIMFIFTRVAAEEPSGSRSSFCVAPQGGRDEDTCDCRVYAGCRRRDIVRTGHRDAAQRCTGKACGSAKGLWHPGSPTEGVR